MKQTFFIATGIFVIIVALFINAKEPRQNGYEIGDLVEDFSLKNVDGSNISLADFPSARGFVMIFTCNTCPYARSYEERIIDLDREFKEKGFPVIAIQSNDPNQSPGDSMEEMRKRAKEKRYSFPYLLDERQEVSKIFGAIKTPHAYVLSKESEGSLRVEYMGAIDNSPREEDDATEKYVEDAINALIMGTKPEFRAKRAVGCSIKFAQTR